jgi:hypothetical protein
MAALLIALIEALVVALTAALLIALIEALVVALTAARGSS